MLTIFVAFLAGFVLGFAQSVLFGVLVIRRWDGGHGFLFGLVVGVGTALSAIWMRWHALYVAAGLAVLIFAVFTVGALMSRHAKPK